MPPLTEPRGRGNQVHRAPRGWWVFPGVLIGFAICSWIVARVLISLGGQL